MRSAIADALRDGCELNASAYQTSRIRPPHAQISYRVDYDLTMARGADEYIVTVSVWTARDNEEQSQKLLDRLADPNELGSVKTVLEADEGVLAVVDYFRVRNAGDLSVSVAGTPEVQYLTRDFECEVAISQ